MYGSYRVLGVCVKRYDHLVDEAASVSTVASAVSAIASGAICITTIGATVSSSTPSTAADLHKKVMSIGNEEWMNQRKKLTPAP